MAAEVVPVYDAVQADPGGTIPASQVTAPLDALHEERLKTAGVARNVVYAPEADEGLLQLYKYIAEHSGPERARGYVARIEAYCMSLAQFPERGSQRDDLRPGLWISGFERQASIAFHVTAATVFIDRVLYGGRDLERSLLGGGEG